MSIMLTTAMWKVGLQEGKAAEFMKAYNLFTKAEGFISCQFYLVKDETNTIIAIESWESETAQKEFMGSLAPEYMQELFRMLAGKPEAYMCEVGELIAK